LAKTNQIPVMCALRIAKIRKKIPKKSEGDIEYYALKEELGELEFYFRKIPLYQQKYLVVSVLSNSPWLPRNLKNGPK